MNKSVAKQARSRRKAKRAPAAAAPGRRGAKPTLGAGFARQLALLRLDSAIAIVSQRGAVSDKGIHETRKAIKRVRALLRLLRPAIPAKVFDACKDGLREAARSIADARDARVVADTLRALTRQSRISRSSVSLRDARPARGAKAPRQGAVAQRIAALSYLSEVRSQLAGVALSSNAWSLLGAGVRTIYSRGRRRTPVRERDVTTEELHEWRKDVKAYWHALELFQAANPAKPSADVREARRLSDILGQDHDLALLESRIVKRAGAKRAKAHGVLLKSIVAKRVRLQKRARKLGVSLYSGSPKEVERKLRAEWLRSQRNAAQRE
jgi:CHAD domain-containing protein